MKRFMQFSVNPSITYAYDASRILGTDTYRVMEDFYFYVGSPNSGKRVFVHKGYLVDGASSPRIVWSIIPPWGTYGPGTIVHDLLCEYLILSENGVPKKITRKECDQIFFETLDVLGVDRLDKFLIKLSINSYRILCNVTEPNWNPKKAALEAEWFISGSPTNF